MAEDSTFYYRRLNELLKISLVRGPDGLKLGLPIPIVKDDVLMDVHAAFRGK